MPRHSASGSPPCFSGRAVPGQAAASVGFSSRYVVCALATSLLYRCMYHVGSWCAFSLFGWIWALCRR